ncbi:MAG: carbohydrate ABC transporter permease [Treponema sp.]|nr:carbohydrate ABC transporter permease [Treponema sp.]
MRKILQKRTKFDRIAFVIVFILFLIYALSLLYPFFWTIITSFKDESDYLGNRLSFPTKWIFTNYSDAFVALSAKNTGLGKMIWNSVWYAFGGTAITVLVSAMSAYVVAKYKFIGRKTFYVISLITMMLPIVGAIPSQYQVYENLNILNNPLFLITFANGMGFNFLILFGYFSSLPWDYVESASIDGAGHFRIFFRIMLPQAASVILSLFIVAFIGTWNDYMNPILFLEDYPTLSSGIYMYQCDILQKNVDIPMLFSGIIMSVIPVLTLFIIFQDKIMNVSLGGGLKG